MNKLQNAIVDTLNKLNKNDVEVVSVCFKTGKIVIQAKVTGPEPLWKTHARAKRKIDAIKDYRSFHGGQACGLREAKDAVEAFMADEGIAYP